jgi:hypothetical protein
MINTDAADIYQEYKRKTKGNIFIINDNTVTGFTHKGEPFTFDFQDFAEIKKYSWLMDKEGYIYACVRDKNGKAKKLRMHRWLLGLGEDYSKVPDHINRTRNDNRRSNLRIVDYSMNGFNRSVGSNNKSGVIGVFYRTRKGKSPKWIASININGIARQVGQFDTKEEATQRRKEVETQLLSGVI